jgi:hypothetical protein
MTNIVFWSPEPGQTGTTSNIIAISILAALSMKKKVCLTQTHFDNKTLESALFGRGINNELLENMGIDILLKASKACELDKQLIENTSFTLLKGLHNLPGTTKINKESFEDDFIANHAYIYDKLSGFFDLVFTDVSAGENKISEALMRSADKIVINLNQNDKTIQSFITKYGHLHNKAVYLIGNYHMGSRYNLINLERCYPFLKKRTSVIPFDVNYMDSFSDGKTIPFFLKNTLATREDDRKFFLQAKKSLELILKDPLEREDEMCC